jgi:GAF domain-containing protein
MGTRGRRDGIAAGPGSDVQDWRVRMLNILLIAVSLVGTAVSLRAVVSAIRDPQVWPQTVPVLAAYLFVLALTVLRGLDPRLRAWGLLTLGYALGILYMALLGLLGNGPVFLLAMPVLGVILIGFRSGLIMAVMTLLIYATFALAASLGWSQAWLIVRENSLEPALWLSQGLPLALLLAALVATQSVLSQAQVRALERARLRLSSLDGVTSEAATAGLGANRASQSATEQTVVRDIREAPKDDASRTMDRLLAARRISRDVSALLDEEPLLQRAADSIAEQLGFEQVSIYLVVASPPGGIALGATSGGRVTAEVGAGMRQSKAPPAVVRVVGSDAAQAALPLEGSALLGTAREAGGRELALPLEMNGQIVGALDVWAAESTSFYSEDVTVLRLLADQLAVVLQKSRLFAEAQASLREMGAVDPRQTPRAWEPYRTGEPTALDRHFGSREVPDETWRSLFEQAREAGVPVAGFEGAGEGRHLLAVPVKLRSVAIGVLGFHRLAGAGPWRDEEIAAIETVGDRLALAVDNARLLHGLRARAFRDRLVGEVGARIRETLDVETVLRTAAQEVRQALGLPEVVVRLAGRPDGDGHGSMGQGRG